LIFEKTLTFSKKIQVFTKFSGTIQTGIQGIYNIYTTFCVGAIGRDYDRDRFFL